MTARRLALAWSWGALTGLLVGWVYGTATRAALDFRALRRAGRPLGAPQPPSGHSETPEGGNGAQTGAQPRWVDLFGIDPDYTDGVPVGEFIERNRAGHDLIPAQRDDEPCPQYSPGGGLTCSVTGPHTAHVFLGSTARDAKEDADEEVE